jgi:hypothetical protein
MSRFPDTVVLRVEGRNGRMPVMLGRAPVNEAKSTDLFGDMMQGPHDWPGLYVGGQVGYAKGDSDMLFGNGFLFELEPEGVIGAASAVYLSSLMLLNHALRDDRREWSIFQSHQALTATGVPSQIMVG